MTAIATARKLRRNSTDAELKLWLELRGRRLGGLKFRRQAPISGFVADFLCEDVKLIVEVDGGQHAEHYEADEIRAGILRSAGYEILRFWNNDVLLNIDGVLEQILEKARIARTKL
jgi:very-short-patch-repair endonuclease